MGMSVDHLATPVTADRVSAPNIRLDYSRALGSLPTRPMQIPAALPMSREPALTRDASPLAHPVQIRATPKTPDRNEDKRRLTTPKPRAFVMCS